MGRSSDNDNFITGTTNYGPWYGFSITYYTTNNTMAPVSAAIHAAMPTSLTLLLSTTVALGTVLA
jgi:hypothetical protein